MQTAGTTLDDNGMVSRDFSTVTAKMCQLQHKTISTQIGTPKQQPKNSINNKTT